ncbi:MAG TPA: ABC transporter permease [Anaerolineales bacterium]|nr:ABC transporter permease [Anaerolineales bacterium]
MINDTKLFFSHYDLVLAWADRTIRGRYQQSTFGWLWALFQPIATVAIFTIVFTRFVPIDTGDVPYVLFSYTAVVPWTFLATSTTDMSASLVQNMNLVTKIYFPREILPIAVMLARFMDFGISAAVLVVLFIFSDLQLSAVPLLYLPLILLIQLALILGVGLLSSALNVFYRDVDPILKLFIQLWFYASPIIYPVSMVPEALQPYYFINPMAGIIVGYRDVLLYGNSPGLYLLPAAAISFTLLVTGFWFFKRVESQFADIV